MITVSYPQTMKHSNLCEWWLQLEDTISIDGVKNKLCLLKFVSDLTGLQVEDTISVDGVKNKFSFTASCLVLSFTVQRLLTYMNCVTLIYIILILIVLKFNSIQFKINSFRTWQARPKKVSKTTKNQMKRPHYHK